MIDIKSPEDKKEERAFSLRVASLGVVSALVAALIGGAVSLAVAHSTNTAFSNRTQRDFLRQQRIAAFSSFLGTTNSLRLELAGVSGELTATDPAPKTEIKNELNDAFNLLTKLKDSEGTIFLVGQAQIINRADLLITEEDLYYAQVSGLVLCLPPYTKSPECSKFKAGLPGASKAESKAFADFETEAKREIGSNY